MKKVVFGLLLMGLLQARLQAQTCTAVPVITLNPGGAGPVGAYMMVAYNPIKNLYYWNSGGYGSNPLATHGPGGGSTLAVSGGNQDWRGLWWNPNTSSLEGNCFNSAGIFSVALDPVSGNALPGSTIVAANQQPGAQSGGQYDPVNNQVLYHNNLSIAKYSRATGSLVATVTITGLPGNAGNISPFGFYTGIPGQEYAIFDYTNKRAYYINYNSGAYVSTVQFPPMAGAPANYALSYANGLFFIYENGTGWVGYQAGIRATHNGPLCVGGSATITAEGADSYTWNTGAQVPSIAVSPTVTSTYIVSSTPTAGCVSTLSVTLHVFPVSHPTIAISGNTLICGSGTNVLTASGASTYSWSNGNMTASVAVSPSVTNTYTVCGTNSVGCKAYNSTTVQVAPTPSLLISGTFSICAGDTAVISVSGANSYSWSNGSTNFSISESPGSTSVYSVIGTGSMGCTSSSSLTLTVHPNPVISISGPMTICENQTVMLTASGANSYTWSNGPTGSSVAVSPSVNTTYTVTGSSGAGCTSADMISISVKPAPTVAISGGNNPECPGASFTLFASGADSYSWSNGAQSSSMVISPPASTVISVTGTSSNNTCDGMATQALTIHPSPNIAISGNNTICAGQQITLTAGGADTYTWAAGSIEHTIAVSPTVNTTYYVSGTSPEGCTGSASITVVVVICTSLEELPAEVISLSPNPSSGVMRLEFRGAPTRRQIELYSVSGQLLEQKESSEMHYWIDLEAYPQGIYFIHLSSGSASTRIMKVVKQ